MSSASDKEKEIHALVILKDDIAFARLCDEYFEQVYKKVVAFNRALVAVDETLAMDVVTDSFMNYFKNPQRYNPEKQSLEGFLVMDASGDLKNACEKLQRRNKKIQEFVGLGTENGNMVKDMDPGPAEHLIQKETSEMLDQKLNAIFRTEMDVQVAHLMLSGERRSTEYAKLLQIEHLETEAQNIEIKRCKDRIDKTIKRKFRGNF